MNKEKYTHIPIARPHMGGRELHYIQDAIDSNWVAPAGKNLTLFEEKLETYLGKNKKVCALSSGTAALHLGLILLGVERGDEVICQSMTFVASANPIIYLGATPVFVDSEPDTWNMCPDLLEDAIIDRIAKGKKPKAIIAVHLYGMPFKVAEIVAIARNYEIPLLEDSAEAFGSQYDHCKCGSFGDFAVLSFNGSKIITTSGGGALVCNSDSQKKAVLHLATQAKDDAPYYEHTKIGYNYRLSNISAGIGCGQMEVVEERIRLRREINSFYFDLFVSKDGISIMKEPSGKYFSNHWLSCMTVDSEKAGFSVEQMRLAFAEGKIESRRLWKPMHLQPVFSKAPFYGTDISEKLFKKGLCLPSSSNLTEEEKQRIRNVIENFV